MADDDSWLYGDDNEEEETPAEDAPLMPIAKPEQEEVEAPPAVEPVEEEKDVEEEKAEEDNDSSDESDDDGINFTIDHVKINDAKESYKNMQLKKNSTTDPSFGPGHKEKKGKFNVEDFDNILTVNGQTAVEVDMESLEDKPWRKPGADITDYFNYGFTEETWAAYCNRQRRMRVNESGVGLALTGQTPILSNSKVLGGVNTNITTIGTIPTLGGGGGAVQSLGGGAVPGGGVDMSKIMSGPPPNNSSGGSLPVKKDEPSGITVMTHEKRIYSNKVLSAMDFSVPPPGFNLPPPGVPPPNIENNDFNPSDPFGEGDMMGGFEPTAQAQWSLPPPPGSWQDQGGGHVTHGPPPELGDRYRDRRDRRDYDRRSRSRSPDRRRRRSRERDTRDRRDRDRDRDRDRGDRDRERDRDRDSDRERKVKKEKRSRSRSRSRSPRHKKSKKDKKERSDREDRDSRETPNKIKEEAKD